MSFLDDLGGIFHSIGHFISGDNTNNQNPAPSAPRPFNPPAPSFQPNNNFQPGQLVRPQNNQQAPAPAVQPQQAPRPANLIQTGSFDPNTPINRGQPVNNFQQAPLLQRVRQINNLATVPTTSTSDQVINTIGDATARAITGIPQGFAQLYDLVSPGHGTNRFTKALDPIAKGVDQDQQDNGLQGRAGNTLYKGTQVIENVVPAATSLIKAAPTIARGVTTAVKAAPDVIKATPDAIANLPGNAARLLTRANDAAGRVFDKVNAATDITKPISTAEKAPGEVATGLSSVNPNQAEDAANHINAQAAAAAPPIEQPQATGTPESQPQPQAPPQSVPSQHSAETSQPAPTQTAPASPVSPEPQPVRTEIASSPNNVAQTENDVNFTPPPSSRTAPNAPNMRPALNKNLDDAAKVAGDPTTHDVLSNQELKDAGSRVVANMPPDELLNKYSSVPDLARAADQGVAHGAIVRLAELSKDADPAIANAAKQAMSNIAEGLERGTSQGARTMNFMQSMVDSLPKEAKVPFVINALNRTRVAAGMAPIGETAERAVDLAGRQAVEAQLNNLFDQSEKLKTARNAVEGRAQEIMNDPTSAQSPKEAAQLKNQGDQLAVQQAQHNGEIERYKASLLPGGSNWEKPADWAKTSMLTAPTGRANNVLNVSGNTLYELVRSVPQSMMAKIGNVLKDPGSYSSTSLFNRGLGTGLKQGFRESGAELKGSQLVDDSQVGSATKSTNPYELVKTADNKGLNKVRNTVQALVRAPSRIIGGAMRDAQVIRDATQEGQAAGYTGDALKAYANARATVPTKLMTDRAQLLQDVVSHMNQNPLASPFQSFLKAPPNASAPLKGIMGLVKNTILPFPKYAATFAWNGLTDKNVVANFAHVFTAGAKGDTDGVFKALSGMGTGAGTMYVGYHMASSGMITTKDGNGYSDSGQYIHIGNRYIPLGTIGMVAPDLIAGAALHDAFSKGGNPFVNFMKTIGSTVWDTVKASGAQSLVGVGDRGLVDVQKALQGGKGAPSKGDAAVALGTQAAGQFIPGAVSDVNAILNHSPLNPTGETADTKVTKGDLGVTKNDGLPSTATDIAHSSIKSLENRIPVLSQTLPRNPGTTANDLIDRTTRGSHVGPSQAQAADLKKTQDASGGPNQVKAQLAADKTAFIKTDKEVGTVNGKTYVNYKGNVTAYNDPQAAQRALDLAKFTDGNSNFEQKNGMVYQRGSDGKVTPMEQKDYDYKNANDAVTSAKNSGDVTSFKDGTGKLLDNISWQLNHADLTQAQRDQLTQKAVQTQEDYAKTQQYGGFTKPKNVDTYATPQITGAKDGYVKTIQEMGAKYGVDINALMSVAAQEGLGGGVGDGGHAFGPFQMNDAGGVLTGKFKSPEEARAYAESPQGIEDAIRQIAAVAKGKTGAEAIKAIVSQFERPADPTSEINNAIALYTGGKATLTPGASGSGGISLAPSDAKSTAASDLIKSNTIGSVPLMPRENFSNNLTAKPIGIQIPQIKLTSPQALAQGRKITVTSLKA